MDRFYLDERSACSARKFEEFGLDARAFAGVKIACVGDDGRCSAALESTELVPSGSSQ